MKWKIAKTVNDLPKNGDLVLIYAECKEDKRYYVPQIWDSNGVIGKF